ncbi:MAG: PGDYG domain-containing protein [Burkholderiaceae bacterium]|jgi:hypothetical protein|nr:PGDYG domain-containing protein [Burkholderiaceae bacterium]
MKYKNQSETVEAVQWFNEGDHPDVIKLLITPEGTVTDDSIIYDAWESSIGSSLVRLVYAVETPEGLELVTPGDYIITHANGDMSPCKPDVFERGYQPA